MHAFLSTRFHHVEEPPNVLLLVNLIRKGSAVAVILFGLLVASCGPSTVNTVPVNSGNVPTTVGTFPLPTPSGSSLMSALSFATGEPADVTLTATSFLSAPPNAILPSGTVTASSSVRIVASAPLANAVPFFWVTFTVSAPINLGGIVAETLAPASALPVAGASYFDELDNITAGATGTKLASYGPGTIANDVLTISSPTTSLELTPGNLYVWQFYYLGTPSPSPTPSSGPVAVLPSSIALIIGGNPTTQNLTVSQAGLQPVFTPSLTCTVGANSSPGTVATIALVGSASPSSPGGSVTFAVAVAASSPTAGTCTGSIASSAGGTPAPFTVTVTATGVVLQSGLRQ